MMHLYLDTIQLIYPQGLKYIVCESLFLFLLLIFSLKHFLFSFSFPLRKVYAASQTFFINTWDKNRCQIKPE